MTVPDLYLHTTECLNSKVEPGIANPRGNKNANKINRRV
jgi:hypothetical protein